MKKIILLAILSTQIFANLNMCDFYVNRLIQGYKNYDKAIRYELYNDSHNIIMQLKRTAKDVIINCEDERYIKRGEETLNLIKDYEQKRGN